MKLLISPHPQQHLLLSIFLIRATHGGCEVVLHCGFDLHIPNNELHRAVFHVLIGLKIPSLEKCCVRILYPFLEALSYF